MTTKRGLPRAIPPEKGIGFAVLDGDPVRFTDFEAWAFVNGQWRPLHPADANSKANVLCDWAFRNRLPPLPAAAREINARP
jgi:hypothetical protein